MIAVRNIFGYLRETNSLVIGKGFIQNVTPAMRAYEISGKTVLDQ